MFISSCGNKWKTNTFGPLIYEEAAAECYFFILRRYYGTHLNKNVFEKLLYTLCV